MRLTIIKTMLLAAVVAASCSKENNTTEIAKEQDPPVDTSDFVSHPTGVTFQKVSNPKGVTDYVLQIPASYNAKKGTKWPVIIFLHGIGERGNDLNRVKNAGLAGIAAKDPNFPFIVISPQCKADTWWDVPSLTVLYKDVLEKYNVDSSRIYLTGLSMGGYGAWAWALAAPEKFAAVVPICGGGTPSKACVLKTKPVWAFHNADDPTVNVRESRNMVNAIRDCGGTLVKYTENPTGGHNAWTKAYTNPALFEWLKAQKL